jgi:hypothetical protein
VLDMEETIDTPYAGTRLSTAAQAELRLSVTLGQASAWGLHVAYVPGHTLVSSPQPWYASCSVPSPRISCRFQVSRPMLMPRHEPSSWTSLKTVLLLHSVSRRMDRRLVVDRESLRGLQRCLRMDMGCVVGLAR